MRVVDTRGEKCPKPIIETRRALRETSAGEVFIVLTDNSTSFKNISRFLSDNGIRYSVSEKSGTWSFEVNNNIGSASTTPADNYCDPAGGDEKNDTWAVVISSELMGSGDDQLGKRLMKSFFISVSCMDKLPALIVFYNSGVKLAAKGSEVSDLISEIEKKGVEIILCGTCVEHFALEGSLCAGSVGDMYQILTKLEGSGKVIRP